MKYLYLPVLAVTLLLTLRFASEFSEALSTLRSDAGLPKDMAARVESTAVNAPGASAGDVLSPAVAARLAELSQESTAASERSSPVPHHADADVDALQARLATLPPPRPDSTGPQNEQSAQTGVLVQELRHAAPTHPEMITPGNFVYLGAFRMPHVRQNGTTFSYGGWALAWNPGGDPGGEDDGCPGSLFIVGHDDHQLVAEVSIPRPRITHTTSLDELPVASVLQPFADCTGGIIARMNVGSATPFQIGGLLVKDGMLHWTIYKYYNIEGENFPSHGRCSLDLSQAEAEGLWHLGSATSRSPEWHSYKHAGYILDVPSVTADQWLHGFDLISGLQISTGLQRSSQGPALFAYGLPARGTQANAELPAIPLTWYSEQTPLHGHHPSDRWTGGAWLELGDKQAVVMFGRKSLGGFYYGDARPGDCTQDKGYHGTPYETQVAFYSPASLIHVAQGQLQAHALEPWYRWNGQSPGGGLSDYLFPTCTQLLGGVAYDRHSNLVYVVQIGAGTTSDNAFEPLPVVHVFHIRE